MTRKFHCKTEYETYTPAFSIQHFKHFGVAQEQFALVSAYITPHR